MIDHDRLRAGHGAHVGRGSFCDIFVESDACGTPASVCKVLRAERATRPVYREALRSEIAVLAKLDQRGLPCLQSADPAAREPWLQYGYLPGETVARAARGAGEGMARRVGTQLLEHLAYLHRGAGIVHGDVAATNVLVAGGERGCRVSLIDFGNAWSYRSPWRRLPQRAYSAPEQSAGREWGAPADIFQAGIIVYEVLTGTRPCPTDATDGAQTALPVRWRRWFEHVLQPDPAARPDAHRASLELPAGRRGHAGGILSFLRPRRRRAADVRP